MAKGVFEYLDLIVISHGVIMESYGLRFLEYQYHLQKHNSFPSAFKIVRTICGTIIADTGGEISKALSNGNCLTLLHTSNKHHY